MLEAGEITKDDTVVEVGPGFGVLTLALSGKAKKVMAFEIERKLESYWTEQVSRHQNIEIVWGNVLKVDLSSILSLKREEVVEPPLFKAGVGGGQYKVIANVPYQITSNIIRKFLEAENKPESMVLMVQKEVAERICASPGDMSVLAVSVQCYADPEIVMRVPRSYFWPAPAVDSAIIKIVSKEWGVRSREEDEKFFKIVKAGFSSRRKMLIKNLGAVADRKKLLEIFKELGISDKARAQELSVDQWRELVKNIKFPISNVKSMSND
jgi:16S rRNA (adenine1518-N6/adenine1519-N6)-dimethyltransferase